MKQIDGNTAEVCRRPGGVNGRASLTTASTAITQNAVGRSGSRPGSAASGAATTTAAAPTTMPTKP